VRNALFAPDGRSVLTADERHVRVWDVGTGRPRGPLLPIEGALIWAQFSDDGSRLMLIDAGGTVRVHATGDGRMVLGPIALDPDVRSENNYQIRRVVALSPDGRRLAVHCPGPAAKETRVYDIEKGRSLALMTASGGYLTILAFSPDSGRLISAATDTLARVWDAGTGEPVGPVMRHPSFVRYATFAPDGRLVVTVGSNRAWLWDSATGDLLAPPLRQPLGDQAAVWFSRDGRRIVGLAPGGAAQQCELPTFRAAADRVTALVQLMTGQQVDASDGIAPLEPSAFRAAPEDYRRAWLSWRGLGDDPAGPSAAEAGEDEGRTSPRALISGKATGLAGDVREASAAAVREVVAGRTQVALGHFVTLLAANPSDTSSLQSVAALQAWFGQDEELADTCGRALEFARGTFDPAVAERTAKICCLRPTKDKVRLDSSLALARRAVALGKGRDWLPWFQMALGMAEYRCGHFAEADATLGAVIQDDKNYPTLIRTSAFYRAMSLYRQGKENEAIQLASEAASKMKPLPKDEKDPLADNAGHIELILWMAYKEARALLKLEPAPAAPAQPRGK
jgi:hypothetical protein